MTKQTTHHLLMVRPRDFAIGSPTHIDNLFQAWPQRRIERRTDVIEVLDRDHHINRTLALEHWENDGRILEGTGSLVLDRQNKIAYACYSERATKAAIHDWCIAMDYAPITFDALDKRGGVIYHTNVMLAVGNNAALVCLDSVRDPEEKSKLTESLALTGKKIIGLSPVVEDVGGCRRRWRRGGAGGEESPRPLFLLHLLLSSISSS